MEPATGEPSPPATASDDHPQDIDDVATRDDTAAAAEDLDLFQILKDAGVEMDMDGELATAIRHEVARIKAQGASEAAAGVNNNKPRWWLRLAKGVASHATCVLLHSAYSLIGNIAMFCLMDLALNHPRARK